MSKKRNIPNFTSEQINRAKLRHVLATSFSEGDLRDLCFDFDLEYENILGQTKKDKARELVIYSERHSLLSKLVLHILANRPHLQSDLLAELSSEEERSPYKGLHYFGEEDKDLFFGRDLLVEELLSLLVHKNLNQEMRDFLAIVGTSGSGKSSLIRAGLIPAIRQQTNWQIHVITPTAHPLKELATSLTRFDASLSNTATLIDDLVNEPRSLDLFATKHTRKNERLLLVVDQFEELFTQCKDDGERTAFIDNLMTAVNPTMDSVVTLIITLRADFYYHCSNYDRLREALGKSQRYIGAIEKRSLREIIIKPAALIGISFESGLVDRIMHDVGSEPGSLPFLSHALLETWKRRERSILTLQGYLEAGGIHGAIAKTAENVYQFSLTPDQKKLARHIFLQLTELGEGTQDTRRRIQLSELKSNLRNFDASFDGVLNILIQARLITVGNDEIEVAHEALILGWPTLRSWLEDSRENLRIHRQLAQTAHLWVSSGRNSNLLFSDAQLVRIQEWAANRFDELTDLEREFLEESQTVKDEFERHSKEQIPIISHELRTPITSIKGYTELLLMEVAGSLTEPQKNYLEVIKNNVDRLRILVDDLLDISRIETSKTRLDLQPLNLPEIIKQVIDGRLKSRILQESRQLNVQTAVPTSLPLSNGDKVRVTQILTNLFDNAINYTPDGGTITVKAQASQDFVYVSVSDNGIGIAPKNKERIFDRFFRVEDSNVQRIPGTGLGLTIVQSLVEMHGGDLQVESELGIGSTFTFSLPIMKQ